MSIDVQGSVMTFSATQHFSSISLDTELDRIRTALKDGSITKCVFDFSFTNLIDSSGIGSLVMLAREFSTANVLLVLKNLNEEIFILFEDTGLDRLFTIERRGDIKKGSVKEFFEADGVDIRLTIKPESVGDVGIFIMSGILSHPIGSSYFKQQLLLFLARYKYIILDFEELTFFDSLSISAILNMNNLLKGTGGAMKICSPNFIVKDLLNTLSIDVVIPVYDQREDALADWRNVNG
ncbi:MAG: STAS domain-containing protein [Fibrobacter sp.]|nr:STAS domain-containing protein [Fibrobacter sp.]